MNAQAFIIFIVGQRIQKGNEVSSLPVIFDIIVPIAIAGLAVFLIKTFVPMPAKFLQAIYIVAGLGLLLYLLNAFGLWSGFQHLRRHR